MPTIPTVPLNTGASIPQLGFGVFQIPPEDAAETVRQALEAGYRSIDTAAAYGNEEGVGEGLRSAGVPREDVFLTTKLWNRDQGAERVPGAFEASLERLGLDDVDLYLIHWPVPARALYVETWRALEQVHASGRARAIGVSNFQVPHLERLLSETDVVPAVNQIELHPYLQQEELRSFHAEHGIVTEAWSPLAQAGDVLHDSVVEEIAREHGRTPAQVILRWHLQIGVVAIPKSVNPERIAENIDLDFELAGDEMERLAGLERDRRVGPHPDSFG